MRYVCRSVNPQTALANTPTPVPALADLPHRDILGLLTLLLSLLFPPFYFSLCPPFLCFLINHQFAINEDQTLALLRSEAVFFEPRQQRSQIF